MGHICRAFGLEFDVVDMKDSLPPGVILARERSLLAGLLNLGTNQPIPFYENFLKEWIFSYEILNISDLLIGLRNKYLSIFVHNYDIYLVYFCIWILCNKHIHNFRQMPVYFTKEIVAQPKFIIIMLPINV